MAAHYKLPPFDITFEEVKKRYTRNNRAKDE